jgi:hypothetical protein
VHARSHTYLYAVSDGWPALDTDMLGMECCLKEELAKVSLSMVFGYWAALDLHLPVVHLLLM